MEDVTIIDYDAQYAPAFKQLNIEWIEKYFTVESHDLEQLSNPGSYIISQGGYILFAIYNNIAVGTCALIKTGEDEFELVKMAVSPHMHGKQVGKQLGVAAVEKAKACGAKRIWLESNRILIPAISLYKKLGFVEIPVEGSPYARADIRMEMLLR
jgi:GNAT superfamily N-acetyltransferase